MENRIKEFYNTRNAEEVQTAEPAEDQSCIFKLEKFEGPLDLLLYLIKKSQIDISDIPIHEITEQYLQYIALMKKLDVNLAAEFIIMAANLIYIKSRMLLPVESDIEEEYFEDPRTELVDQLLEYQQFKNAASELDTLAAGQSNYFFRSKDQIVFDFDDKDNWVDINLFDLINIFNKLLNETKAPFEEYVIPETLTVSMKIEEIHAVISSRADVDFRGLFSENFSKWELIITFLAILELVKQKVLLVKQHKLFGDIKIYKRM